MNQLQQLIRGERPHKVYLPAWLEALASLGIAATDPLVARRQRLTNVFAFASAGNVLSHVLVTGLYEFGGFLGVHIFNLALAAAILAVPRLHRVGAYAAAHALVLLSVAGILFSLWVYGRSSQVYVYLTLTGIVLFLFGTENWRHYGVWLVVALASLLLGLAAAPPDGLLLPEDRDVRSLLATHVMINTLGANALMIFYALSTLRRTETELESQHARSTALINTVLPPSIAERLTSGTEERIADRIDGLTVLFADLVGFTKAARDLPPEQIIDYLDAMVRAFDQLCAKHGAEKIKTIGDCYMAVGGLTGDGRAQAIAMGNLAVDMIAMQAKLPALGEHRLAIRIGLHTGSATAGIIGDTRFAYDVWGDAVNIASRMESHGLPGRIQVSGEYLDAVGDAFQRQERGVIEVRGIGPVRTYFLEVRKS